MLCKQKALYCFFFLYIYEKNCQYSKQKDVCMGGQHIVSDQNSRSLHCQYLDKQAGHQSQLGKSSARTQIVFTVQLDCQISMTVSNDNPNFVLWPGGLNDGQISFRSIKESHRAARSKVLARPSSCDSKKSFVKSTKPRSILFFVCV